MRTVLVVSALAAAMVGLGPEARGEPPTKSEAAASTAPAGTVLTFYGLRRLEQDPNVADDVKVTEWAAFVARATEQIAYAKKAQQRWKEAAKLRLVESARLAEKNEAFTPRQRIAQWQAVLEAYPREEVGRRAKERAAYWRSEELARLIREAEAVEGSGAPKVDRIRAWLSVVGWSAKSKSGRAARRRVDALQKQLFAEAESVDAIGRIDAAVKLEAWRDVLDGDPSKTQRSKAQQRVKALEAQLDK